ncbi:MAG: SCP2 sterol-binding domain-containing protein, partial [Deltaproteobacteria bacterium]|nr:SCP2 sterol-binding domain-containing protein [Deltaproteobacteria bacterium]
CWTKTPGVCVHKDDMAALLKKMGDFDTLIMAQPLYIYTVPGLVKDFMDRCLPGAQPFMVTDKEGRTTHPSRWPGAKARIVIFSVCGFPEPEHFDPLLATFQHFYRSADRVIVGQILRPAAESLPQAKRMGKVHGLIMDAFNQAGKELVEQGYISQAAEQEVQRPIFRDTETFHSLANTFWRISIGYHQAKKEGADLPPFDEYLGSRPDMMLTGMAASLNPEAAGDLSAFIQFEVTDQAEGSYYLEIKETFCRCHEGRADAPDLTIRTPWEVWLAISNGEITGQEAMMEGKYEAQGDLSLMMRMGELFGG